MSMAERFGISEELFAMVNDGLDRALQILAGDGEAFNPLVLVEGGERPQLQRIIAPQPEQAVNAGRVLIGRMGEEVLRYALVFDGRITVGEEKHDAVVVEAGERGSDFGIAVAQRYRPADGGEGVEAVGNPRFMGRFGNHLAPKQQG